MPGEYFRVNDRARTPRHADNERCDQLAAAEMAKLRKTYTRAQLAALRDQFLASREPNCEQTSLL